MTATTDQARPARDGVDTPTLFATIDAVREHHEIADFTFRAHNTWVSGTHNRTTIQGFFGAGQEDSSRTEPFVLEADHPAILVGANNGPTAVESLLHSIAACLTHGIANIAAARGITLHRVESRVEGDIDLLGVLGLDEGRGSVGVEDRCSFCSITFDAPAAVTLARVGDLEGARHHLALAQASSELWQTPAWHAAVLEARSALAAAEGDEEAAREHLRHAVETYSMAGQVLDARRCKDLLPA